MKNRTASTALILAALMLLSGPPNDLEGQSADVVSVDNLLSIGSVVGGRDAPQWRPDGSGLAFMSGLYGGLNVVEVDPDGGPGAGFPRLLFEDLSLVGTGSPGSQKPQFSPDGRWMGYVSSKGGAPEIWLWSTADGRDIQLTDLGGRVNALKWSPGSDWIVFSNDRYGSQDIWKVSIPDGQVVRLTSDDVYEVYPAFTPDGEHILYVRMDERWVDHDVLEIPADGSAAPRLVVRDTGFFDYRAGLSFGTARPSPDGELVLFRSVRSGWHNFWVVPRDGGEPRPVAAAEGEQSHARWSPDGSHVVYVENRDATSVLKVAPLDGGAARTLVSPATFGDDMGAVGVPEWSPDGGRISFTYATPTSPDDLYTVDVGSGDVVRLTRSMPDALEARLPVPEKIAYQSTDGYTIQSYLYRPAGLAAGERVPAIVWVHGGPTGQFDDSFGRHQQVQYFAQRGYAILMPNVRGSSGYGLAFEDANNQCWGHCDMEDVRAGVEYLQTLPEVDGEKIGISGTSYGGILSMAAITFAPGLFQAAIPISGYGDMTDFHTSVPELQHIQLLRYELGDWPGNEDVYYRTSPIHFVEQVQTPALVLHGEGLDVGWRPGQQDPEMASLDFVRALDKHYKIYRYKSYPGETYYVYGRENTKQKLQDMLAFFDQYLKDGAELSPYADTATTETGGG